MADEPQTSTGDAQNQYSPPSSSSSDDRQTKQSQLTGIPSVNGDFLVLPAIYPTFYPEFYPLQQNHEQINHGRGLYAVPTLPFMGPTTGFVPNILIPFTYNVPTASSSLETGNVGQDQGQQQQPLQPQQMQAGQQRQVVVRRFQIAFQLDLPLILKLVAVIFLFNQDGSRQRLILLVFLSSLVYLYQTGALAPLIRWLSQKMLRAAAPPRPPRPNVRADNAQAAERAGNENVAAADGRGHGENENQPINAGNREAENEQGVEPAVAEGGQRWWGIVKEIQMIVFGFITSLLPGFHNID